MKHHISSSLASVVVLVGLVACGDNLGNHSAVDARVRDAASASDGTTSDGATDAPTDAPPDAVILTTPTVIATTPASAATSVPRNTRVRATFSVPMDPATFAGSTFTLTGAAVVPGTVIYADSQVVFWPTANLAANTVYTATISTAAESSNGVALAAPHTWSFTTGPMAAPGVPVDLGTAVNFVILAKAGISTVPASVITGNIGVSPIDATAITGFTLTVDASNVFSRSTQVSGKVFAANYAAPTPANLTTAIGDMDLAFTAAAARAADVTELGAGDIGGMTLRSGVYKWSSGLLIPTSITLTGSATDVWIFQVAQGLTVSNGATVTLTGGALAKNVFWQVSGAVALGTSARVQGIVLGATAITLATSAAVRGRLLAGTAITLDKSTVAQP